MNEPKCTAITRAGQQCNNSREPGLDVCRLHKPDRDKSERCKARLKGGEAQCNNRPVNGFPVCRMHGAGTRKRVADGTRKDPSTAGLKHGLYATKARGKIAERAKAYAEADAAQLFNITSQAASLHGALDVADEAGDLDAYAKIMAQLLKVTQHYHKMQQAGAKVVPESEVVALISSVCTWVRELVLNGAIPREEIHQRLAGRLMEFARKLGAP